MGVTHTDATGPLRIDLTHLSVPQLQVLQALLGDILSGNAEAPALPALLNAAIRAAAPDPAWENDPADEEANDAKRT